jgi:hypothetical protein
MPMNKLLMPVRAAGPAVAAGLAMAMALPPLAAQSPAPAAAAVAAPMDSAPMQRCRIIAEPAARLACYDAIALPGLGSRAGWGVPAPQAAAAPSAAPAPSQAATAEAADPADRFGLERRDAQAGPDRLESRLAESISGWEPNTRFTFENGQVWQVVDGSRAFYGRLERPKVIVSRGLLGSFYLQIDGVNQTPRVRRVQ